MAFVPHALGTCAGPWCHHVPWCCRTNLQPCPPTLLRHWEEPLLTISLPLNHSLVLLRSWQPCLGSCWCLQRSFWQFCSSIEQRRLLAAHLWSCHCCCASGYLQVQGTGGQIAAHSCQVLVLALTATSWSCFPASSLLRYWLRISNLGKLLLPSVLPRASVCTWSWVGLSSHPVSFPHNAMDKEGPKVPWYKLQSLLPFKSHVPSALQVLFPQSSRHCCPCPTASMLCSSNRLLLWKSGWHNSANIRLPYSYCTFYIGFWVYPLTQMWLR